LTLVAFLKYSGLNFVGTSNVWLAKKHGLAPIGTMAHEFLQAGQATGGWLPDSQKRMLQAWTDEYRGDLGIALTDVIGIDAFLKDFDLYFAKLYDGLRHDSGDPYWWADKVIAHYENLGIDPKTKSLVFSDGLDFNKCAELHETYKNITNVSFGIGTNLTNDFNDVVAPKIVIKMIECNGQPVAKISDSPGKGMCEDSDYVDHLKKVFGVEK
jgi:nicotinate phosphoribosyltransferase